MTNQKLTIGLVVAILIAIGGYFFPQQVKTLAGGVVSTADVAATNFTELTASVGMQTPIFQLGGTTAATSVQSQVSTGSCAAGTSTAFAVANPYTSTSTATLISIAVTGQATTSFFMVGTSTQSTGQTPSTVSTTFASTTISTSSVVYLTPGLPSFNQPSGGNNRTIAVAPNEFITAFSTSSAIAGGTYTQGLTCTYKIEWRQ